ncbi:MAG: bifunctional aldolase/short-chain dehydrogenase [Gammaproteobacteria bacterium]|nr:bifunctional aldolase/short-chain dehydrogenase [Gammaproteobacteria bacterium]
MKSLWNDKEASQYNDDLGLRVYTSRLLGLDASLVLHGGGNTSVKITENDIFDEPQKLLYVKGSGWDLETIDRPGFAPVDLDHLIKLAELPVLSDPDMVNELRTNMTNASAPTPSVEAILHATLPFKFVDHTHADAIVTITNNADGKKRIEEIYGDRVVIIDYIMPGFDLARVCAKQFAEQAHDKTEGMVLLNHGIFSFADTAQESYERMISLVNEAEEYLKTQNAWDYPQNKSVSLDSNAGNKIDNRIAIAQLRQAVSSVAGCPMILSADNSEKMLSFAQQENILQLAKQGPATPDHVIRTKQFPMLGRDVDAYVEEYKGYFEKHASHSKDKKTMLDPAPRVIIDPEIGVVGVGKTAKDAKIVTDIYDHTVDVISRATLLGGYQALPGQDIFDMEYWVLEQAKLKKSGNSPEFTGEIVLVTGGYSGIGKACVDAMMKNGAAVVALDINPGIENLYVSPNYLGLICDVTDEDQLCECLSQAVTAFGGLDMVVLNAGMFPGGCAISEMTTELWKKVMAVNLDANLALLREAYPLLKLSPKNGRVSVVGSKNVPAPGPGAAAYSASKAALTQLSRITAMEWGKDGIRINIVHPDAVFDTGIWTDEVLQARAKHYGMTVQEYKTKNILKTEISSNDVAQLVVATCSHLFAKTTAAQIPIDGGNDRVI